MTTPRQPSGGSGNGRRQPPRGAAPRPAAPRGQSAKAQSGKGQPTKGQPAKGQPARSPQPGKGQPAKAAARTPRAPQQRRPEGRPPARSQAAVRPRRPQRPKALRLAEPKRRLRVITVVMSLVFSVFAGRLVQLQLLDSDALAADANTNRYQNIPITAERGSITSSDGVALAATVDAYDITADPAMFTPAATGIPDAPEQAAALLAPILGVPKEKIAADLHTPKTRYKRLAAQQTPATKSQISDLKASLEKQAGSRTCQAQKRLLTKPADQGGRTRVDNGCANPLAGVFNRETQKRIYPADGLAANLVGFVNGEGEGAGGLELQYQKQLAGKDGHSSYAQAGGRLVPTAGGSMDPAVPGNDVKLTINRDIQWAAQRAITDQVANSGAEKGYVVVQDVKTGQVLAMATAPGFNPNDLSTAKQSQLGNAALQDAYEPGSTAKLMSLAAVLDTGKATWDTKVTVPNRLVRAGQEFKDDVNHDPWYLTLAGVLAKSSNIGTIEAAETLGADQAESNRVLDGYMRKFGVAQPTGLNFPGESSGMLKKPEDLVASEKYNIAFGQGPLQMNALQATSVYSTIANGGVRVAPSIVQGTTSPGGKYTPTPPGEQTRVVSPETAKTLTSMLESVVDDEQGTGGKAAIPGYRVAGKTGTANRGAANGVGYDGYTASFIGFAPADAPRYTVSCTLQGPVNGHFGGQLCGPVFKQVMEFTLKTMQVPPSGSQAPNLPVEWKP
ncbi:cell division protein FtsI (penicillin-binding protein 3) [Kitasatospora sp. MAA19]|uniref:peptidoglycan D,D-transpeptidase FtsI family protein n=1 Tax=unclassified Kitasatospora TaxID=2633591 RepID=UPI00247506A0|nr:penicillin-binding protein 2 [Kitasatospora sp. MAA19]MDH6704247.1 cell division protein FtsI (penicillin-binding protein 3) [Kitasatospora sp. MAA19]